MKKCVHIFVHGLVQGVCFRAYTEKQATNLNLTGWVRNRRDGRVEIMAEGSEPELKEFIDWCGGGSPYSRVDTVDISWVLCEQDFNTFDVDQTK
ncbi:MAG: Acylphosphatase [Candidatus Argoarchaeum ethanivorans]|uniref:Acylphosphatase n=1 Tax=Candidatus Argoarchaeum ethanivorans TaxID=2608793 RepID=A0A811T7Z5_9EURY|nr:MAG: Acylphosphatase [Candidatus Argoarchaeum ethanivorans]